MDYKKRYHHESLTKPVATLPAKYLTPMGTGWLQQTNEVVQQKRIPVIVAAAAFCFAGLPPTTQAATPTAPALQEQAAQATVQPRGRTQPPPFSFGGWFPNTVPQLAWATQGQESVVRLLSRSQPPPFAYTIFIPPVVAAAPSLAAWSPVYDGVTRKYVPAKESPFVLPPGAGLRTRLYFPTDDVAPASPSFDAAWEYTSEAERRRLAHVKGSSAITLGPQVGPWTPGQDALERQYVSAPLAGGQGFGPGSIRMKMQILAREYNNTDNVDQPKVGVRIISGDGSVVRATLFTVQNWFPGANEFINSGVNGRNATYADGDPSDFGSTYTTVTGDRLVVEIGYSDTAGTTPEASLRWGEAGTDLPENETTTADNPGWIEFSKELKFLPEVPILTSWSPIYDTLRSTIVFRPELKRQQPDSLTRSSFSPATIPPSPPVTFTVPRKNRATRNRRSFTLPDIGTLKLRSDRLTGAANEARIEAPTGMTSSYNLIMPSTLPGTSKIARIDENNQLLFDGFVTLGAPSAVTISSGVITATSSFLQVDTEAAAASDDLDTINGAPVSGTVIWLMSTDNARDIVVKHLTGNIKLIGGVDITLGTTSEKLQLIWDGTIWTNSP